MKKIKLISALITAALFTVLFCLFASAARLGDVTGDGEITAADARLCLRRAVGLETYGPWSEEFYACDVIADGEITAADARLILRAAVGLEYLPESWEGEEDGLVLLDTGDARITFTGVYLDENDNGNLCYFLDMDFENDTPYYLEMGYYNLGVNGVIDGFTCIETVDPYTVLTYSTYIPCAMLESGNFPVEDLEEVAVKAFIYRWLPMPEGGYEVDYTYDYEQTVYFYPYGGGRSEYWVYYDEDDVLEEYDEMLIIFEGFTSQTYSNSGYVLDLTPNLRFLNTSDDELYVELVVTEINGKSASCYVSRDIYGHYLAYFNESLADMLDDDYYYGDMIRFTINVYNVDADYARIFHGEYTAY